MPSSAYHQLGRFIVQFQHLEGAINDILELAAGGDSEATLILINELEYSRRLDTADVLFARFVDLHREREASFKDSFHTLIVKLRKLGERRNELVHSRYFDWVNIDGSCGLLRSNSRLRGRKGEREEQEEELLPDAFDKDLEELLEASKQLEAFRLQIVEWLDP